MIEYQALALTKRGFIKLAKRYQTLEEAEKMAQYWATVFPRSLVQQKDMRSGFMTTINRYKNKEVQ